MRVRWLGGAGCVAIAVMLAALERPVYSHKPITTPIIFKKEVAQIFQRKCFQCHSGNNLAMALTTYELARPWARAIREELLDRRMPPWGAVTGFGHFTNDVSLTQREMDIILSWADGGAPSGVLKVEESIPPVYVPDSPQWDAGKPDEIITPDVATTVEANSGDRVQRFDLRGTFAEPRALKGIAFKPGDRRVVRYAAIYESATRRWLYTWTPWHTAMTLPDGIRYRVPARARFTVEIGYHAAEETVTDKSELGLYFDEAKSTQEVTSIAVTAPAFEIAPRSAAQRVRAETIISDKRVLAIWPELGPGVTSFEVSAASPDGVVEPLLWVKDFRRDWPTSYVLEAPVSLPRGTRVIVTAYYANNSDKAISVRPSVSIVTAPHIRDRLAGRSSHAKPRSEGRSASREGRDLERKRNR